MNTFRRQITLVMLGMGLVLLAGSTALAQTQHFTFTTETGGSYSIVVMENAECGLLPDDEIGVFDGSLCVGGVVVTSSWPRPLSANEDDPKTNEIDGFECGNPMSFRIWRAASDEEVAVDFVVLDINSADGTFCSQGTAYIRLEGCDYCTDEEPPVIICPPELIVQCGSNWLLPEPESVTDDCDPDPVVTSFQEPLVVTCPYVDGLTHFYVATDASGKADTCSFDVLFIDDTPPEFTFCPPDSVVPINYPYDPNTLGYATATDVCDPTPVVSYYDSMLTGGLIRYWFATDNCGNVDTCEQHITLDDPGPEIVCPVSDLEAIACGDEQACVDLAIDYAESVTVAPFGDWADGQLCFDAPISDQYTFTVTAYSGDWSTDCELTVDVTVVPEVTIECPESSVEVLLAAPGQFCIYLPIHNYGSVAVPVGLSWANDQLCAIQDVDEGTYPVQIVATALDPSCPPDTCEFEIVVSIIEYVEIDCPVSPEPVEIAPGGQACIGLPIVNANLVEITGVDGATWANGVLCFYPVTDGEYPLTVIGSNNTDADTCHLTVAVTIMALPIIDCPDEVITHELCGPGEICVGLPIINHETVEVTGVDGAVWDAGELCFFAESPGIHSMTVIATAGSFADTCDIEVNMLFTPVVTIDCPDEDVQVKLPGPDYFCIDLPIENYLIVNTPVGLSWSDGQLCALQEVEEGVYPVTVEAMSMNPNCPPAVCEFNIVVTYTLAIEITCPDETIAISSCPDDEICVEIPIVNADAVLIEGDPSASWSDDHFCFTPATDGEHHLTIIATNSDDTATCHVTVDVTFNESPEITCPDPTTEFVCPGDELCVAIPIAGATTVVTNYGNWSDGILCFVPDTAGTYNISVTAENECGTTECQIMVEIAFVPPPTACFTAIHDQSTGSDEYTVDFDASCSMGYIVTYNWDFGDGATSHQSDPSHTYLEEGCFTVVLTVHDDCGRTAMASREICTHDGDVVIPSDRWIVIGCELPTVDGLPLPPGTAVAAYDPSGVLCGFSEVDPSKLLVLTIYGDSPYTMDIDEGPMPGETVSIVIGGMPVVSTPPVVWTENGDVLEVCDFVSQPPCTQFDLGPGWHLISWNNTYTGTIAEFVSHMDGCVDVILSFDQGGLTYDPIMPQFSTLNNVDYYHGYWIRLNCPVSFELCGDEILANEAIAIHTNWNLVSYWPDHALSTETALASVMSYLLMAVGFDAGLLTYLPGDPSNTLVEMMPGFGYWIRSGANGSLNYPGYAGVAPGKNNRTQPAALGDVTPSREWMTVYGADLQFGDQTVSNGSVFEVLTSEGLLVGQGRYQGGMLKLTPVYGWDGCSSSGGYPRPGEQLELRIDGEPTGLELTMEPTGSRVNLDALNKSSTSTPTGFALVQNYPNPFNPTTEISFSLPEAAIVRLDVYNMLGQRVETLVDSHFDSGHHTVTWDASGVSSGVYFYRLEAADYTSSKRMLLLK